MTHLDRLVQPVFDMACLLRHVVGVPQEIQGVGHPMDKSGLRSAQASCVPVLKSQKYHPFSRSGHGLMKPPPTFVCMLILKEVLSKFQHAVFHHESDDDCQVKSRDPASRLRF